MTENESDTKTPHIYWSIWKITAQNMGDEKYYDQDFYVVENDAIDAAQTLINHWYDENEIDEWFIQKIEILTEDFIMAPVLIDFFQRQLVERVFGKETIEEVEKMALHSAAEAQKAN